MKKHEVGKTPDWAEEYLKRIKKWKDIRRLCILGVFLPLFFTFHFSVWNIQAPFFIGYLISEFKLIKW